MNMGKKEGSRVIPSFWFGTCKDKPGIYCDKEGHMAGLVVE